MPGLLQPLSVMLWAHTVSSGHHVKVHRGGSQRRSVVSERIEPLEGVSDERQAEIRVIALSSSLDLSAHLGRIVDLRDLVDREVLGVYCAGELGLERRADLAEAVPVDAVEEGVLLELGRALSVAEAVLRVADEAENVVSKKQA